MKPAPVFPIVKSKSARPNGHSSPQTVTRFLNHAVLSAYCGHVLSLLEWATKNQHTPLLSPTAPIQPSTSARASTAAVLRSAYGGPAEGPVGWVDLACW